MIAPFPDHCLLVPFDQCFGHGTAYLCVPEFASYIQKGSEMKT